MRQLSMTNWICYAVGYVFITTGIVKLTVGQFKVIFSSLGLPYPDSFLYLVAIVEIVCGTLIISRLYMKRATAILIFIILAAIYLTKLPILASQGILMFAYEARLDIVMLILLLLLWQRSGGKTLL
ncbi:DoxX family protein [Virgibacillus kekensis]|uniref:DoxX family protein n=1 Tax=Virgibacillus kekensis TaxID=202261 RepID=A0ABV9DKD6_9BACI